MATYMINENDVNLLSHIEYISTKIYDVYKRIIEDEIDEKTDIKKEYIDELNKLRKDEEVLYKEIANKENRSIAFRYVITKKHNINKMNEEDYDCIRELASDLLSPYRRIRANLSIDIGKELIKNDTELLLNEVEFFKSMSDELGIDIEELAKKSINLSCALYDIYFIDVLNTFLTYLEEEINKPLNKTIKKDLISTKYNIICSNSLVEDRFLKNKGKIDDIYCKGINLVKELYCAPDPVIVQCNKDLFANTLRLYTQNALILGNLPYDSQNFKNILLQSLMIKCILVVADDENLVNEVYNTLQINKTKIKENNIGEYLIKDTLDIIKKPNNKILNLTLQN